MSDLGELHVFGKDLPVLAEIGDGWFWVQHPNGPAVANENCLSTLGAMFPNTLEDDDPELVLAIKAAGVLDELLAGRNLLEGERAAEEGTRGVS